MSKRRAIKILFSHTDFPAQFGEFGAWLAEQGWEVMFAAGRGDARPPRGTRMFLFEPATAGAVETHRHARGFDQSMRTAESFAAVAIQVRARGFCPDVIVAHSGRGAGAYAKAVWPEARFVPYVEWWYSYPRPDMTSWDPTPPCETAARARAAARNASMLVDFAQADLAICPTEFQAAQFPPILREKIVVCHDGVACDVFRPDAEARARLAEFDVPTDAELVTYATRGMEPYRGFPEFIRALAILQRQRPRLVALVAGEDRVAYGMPPKEGGTWKQKMLKETEIDLGRLRFVGMLPREKYMNILQATDLHVYLTTSFVLSWSFVEAMSTGCPMVASDVPPIHEALGDSGGALLVDHVDPVTLATVIAQGLDDPRAARARGDRARLRALGAYDRAHLWPRRAELLRRVAMASS